ncbi:MAG: hypothetical protein U5K51_04855 [Flavobacteriaceae bacterium]|nr:hypothetical protein [Flavobacteriaceae bacterium]
MLTLSKFISYALHPILFSTIGSLLYFLLSPSHISKPQEHVILVVVFVSTYLLPLLLLYILKHFQLINSFELETIEERKFPILFLVLLTYLIGRMLLSLQVVDLLAYSFYGSCLALLISYLLFYLKIKTSIHTMGIGSLIGFIVMMSIYYEMNFNLLLAVFIILAGFIGSARLALGVHKPVEIFLGIAIGIGSQLLVFFYNR